ncbi:MAG: hypothetical protein HYS06_00320 [Methylocystis sp.]|nr:hypothetical protein [Methylocystis sp.]MBI3275493.1 hypothetical protein [Methylocystis sp.]
MTADGAAPSAAEPPVQALTRRIVADRVPQSPPASVASLTAALRRARIENAERSGVLADLRGAELARLEILRDHLEPVLAQAPEDCDVFDVGIAPGEHPRLFIDHLGFIEMGRDRRAYRFLQDTRHGRIVIGESENLETVVEAVTAYVAHRLIERERALTADFASAAGAGAFAAADKSRGAADSAPPASSRLWRGVLRAFLFLVEAAGSALFFAMIGLLGFWLYRAWLAH